MCCYLYWCITLVNHHHVGKLIGMLHFDSLSVIYHNSAPIKHHVFPISLLLQEIISYPTWSSSVGAWPTLAHTVLATLPRWMSGRKNAKLYTRSVGKRKSSRWQPSAEFLGHPLVHLPDTPSFHVVYPDIQYPALLAVCVI